MVEHSASVTISAPVHQVYALFAHFDDFPKFMSSVREVTYYDEQRTHWVVQVMKPYEWDAVNEDWIPDQQIGWRSISGLRNSGKVKFRSLEPESTIVDVYIQYDPPAKLLGQLAEMMGRGSYCESLLQKDLHHFARMVEQTPAGALDPMSSHYLFHKESAAARNLVTNRQLAAWQEDPRMNPQALAERQARIEREMEQLHHQQEEHDLMNKLEEERKRRVFQEQQALLAHEAKRLQQEELVLSHTTTVQFDPHSFYTFYAHGLGDRDGLRARIPNFTQDPMTSRRPS